MTNRAAGIRYARALFDVSQKEADIEQVGRELADFAQLIAAHEALPKIFSNPAIPAPRKKALLEQLIARAGAMTPVVTKLLLMLAERDRMAILPDVSRRIGIA